MFLTALRAKPMTTLELECASVWLPNYVNLVCDTYGANHFFLLEFRFADKLRILNGLVYLVNFLGIITSILLYLFNYWWVLLELLGRDLLRLFPFIVFFLYFVDC